MSSKAKYGVKFVGYSGYVIARKYGREVDYAHLDFISGVASVLADGGWVMVSKRADLGPFLKDLPNLASELRKRLAVGPEEGIEVSRDEPGRASKMVSMSCGQNKVWIAPDTDVNKFIRHITKRFAEIEQALEQVEQIGSLIERRPYSEYIDEIGKTGIARVEGHGFGLFIDGKLIFYPDHQVALTKPSGPNTFEVHLLENAKAGPIN